ncbi:MAG TPA: hypothetical protein VIY56_14160, partial [Vicinamibacterales bacterium]
HPHGPEGARLTALLGRARTRLGRARLLQTLSLCVPTVVAALVILSWLTGRTEPPMAAGATLAIVGAGLLAWFRTPHAAALAALLDERLRLADRVGTAVRVGARADAVALLIQRDAVAHVTPAGIESAFPFRVHRWTWLACAVVVASAGLWLVERPGLPNGASGTPSGGGITVRTPRGASSNAAAQGPESTSVDSGRALDQPPPAAAQNAQAPPFARTAEGEGARDGGARTDLSSLPAEGRAAGGQGAGAGDQTSARGRDGGVPGDGSTGQRVTAAGRSRDVGDAAARGATDAGTGTEGRAEGGVQFGRRLEGRFSTARDDLGPPSAAAIRQGQLRADTAIAHDEVPPRYRAYLRDYFRTVQAMSEP